MRKILQLVIFALVIGLAACDSGDPASTGGPVAMRRLTPEQYRNAIEDLFGTAIDVSGRFEPDSRRSGLNAVGTSLVAVTPSGFEQYEAMARNIAAQVTSTEHRNRLLPCKPESATASDDSCTEQIVASFGRLLLRRPLGDDEVHLRVEFASAAAESRADFYAGLELALTSLLVAPDFIFRIEVAEPAPLPDRPYRLLLSDHSLASRLSYFLWNRGPDEDLLTVAERGELDSPAGLAREVDRLLASEHLAGGVRAFFEDLFVFDEFNNLGKDVTRFPLYSNRMAADAREQTLRFVVKHLVTKQADYRELFTSRELPITRSLGPLYGVPVYAADGWEEMELPSNHPRAGLLSHASFAMLFSHPGRSSPTLRGVFLREALLCQTVPEAPADVDFSLFVQDADSRHRTARDRLQVHANEASCNTCHKLTDPIGLGLEVFDGIGKYRTSENGAPIDTSSDLDGRSFANPVELGQAFAESPLIGPCLVQNLYRYAVGREQTNRERRLLRHLEVRFEETGYRLPELMRDIAMSEGFRTASAPREDTAEQTPAGSAKEET
ncbi:MAG: DUF1592 domain-containing protein [Gammaproteobacteria bacterium]|nr:DUF1592 domain-containing protein [Gammaproteobacteria bacterium]